MMAIFNEDHTSHFDGDEDRQFTVPNSAVDIFVRVIFDIKFALLKSCNI